MPGYDVSATILRKEPLTMDEVYVIVEHTRSEMVHHLARYSLCQLGHSVRHFNGQVPEREWNEVRVSGDPRFSLRTRGIFEFVQESVAVYGITKDNRLLIGCNYFDAGWTEVRFQEAQTLRELCGLVRSHPWRVQQQLLFNELSDWMQHRRDALNEATLLMDVLFGNDRIIERLIPPWDPPAH